MLVTEVILCTAPRGNLVLWVMGTSCGSGLGLVVGRLFLDWLPLGVDTLPGGVQGADLELVISCVFPFNKSFLRLSYMEALMPSSWLLLTLTLMGSQGTQAWPSIGLSSIFSMMCSMICWPRMVH